MRKNLEEQLKGQCINAGYGNPGDLFLHVSDEKFEQIRKVIASRQAKSLTDLTGRLKAKGLLKMEPHVKFIGKDKKPALALRRGYLVHKSHCGVFMETTEDPNLWTYTNMDFEYDFTISLLRECSEQTRSIIILSYICEAMAKLDGIQILKYAEVFDKYIELCAGELKVASLKGETFSVSADDIIKNMYSVYHEGIFTDIKSLLTDKPELRVQDVEVQDSYNDVEGTIGVMVKTTKLVAFTPTGGCRGFACSIDSDNPDIIDAMWRRAPYVLLKLAGLGWNKKVCITSNKPGYVVKPKEGVPSGINLFEGRGSDNLAGYLDWIEGSDEYFERDGLMEYEEEKRDEYIRLKEEIGDGEEPFTFSKV